MKSWGDVYLRKRRIYVDGFAAHLADQYIKRKKRETTMPVRKRGRFWYMGSKKFKTKAAALRAHRAYLAKRRKKK